MNYFDTLDKILCCGCTACASVCPVSCIDMKEDDNGFLYPIIDKVRCIDCGLCKKVCPLADEHSNKLANKVQNDCYAFTCNNDNLLNSSTSGGAFATIVNGFCNNDYVVYGVKFNEDFTLEYSAIKDKKDIEIFGGSKYFQSEMKNCFNEIRDYLENSKKVVFSGTPCHIAGLKSYLGKDYNNLLCVDIICFGVPSKKAFLSYKKYLENKYEDKLIAYKFRSKRSSGIVATFLNIGDKNIMTGNDYYMRGFYSRKMHRDCCTQCQFKKVERQGDITIGDFWGINNISNKFNLDKGVSLVILNTDKGKSLIDNFADKGLFEKFNLNDAVNYNQLKPFKWQGNIDFYDLIDKGIEFDKAIKTIMPLSFKLRIKATILKLMPKWLITDIKKFLRK